MNRRRPIAQTTCSRAVFSNPPRPRATTRVAPDDSSAQRLYYEIVELQRLNANTVIVLEGIVDRLRARRHAAR